LRLELHRDALADLLHAAEWYEGDYPGRGVRFRAAVERVFARIAAAPHVRVERLGARIARVPRFPYVVVYSQIDGERLRVLAVAHTKRRPGYWRARS
jgi:plasmid stabilization system protein ParE